MATSRLRKGDVTVRRVLFSELEVEFVLSGGLLVVDGFASVLAEHVAPPPGSVRRVNHVVLNDRLRSYRHTTHRAVEYILGGTKSHLSYWQSQLNHVSANIADATYALSNNSHDQCRE
jgi:hypothetical protein